MFEAYKHYADFQGRAGRSEYWLFALFVFIVAIVFVVLGMALSGGRSEPNMLIMLPYFVFVLGSLVPSLAVGFRRLHDTDRSAWWLLIAFIPFLGSLVLLVFYCLPGTPGPNRFGSAPGTPPTEGLQATFS